LGWGTHGDLLNERERIDSLPVPERGLLAEQAFVAEVTRWCVETSRARLHPAENVHVLFYESLVASPETEFLRLGAYLDRFGPSWRSWKPDAQAVARPSKTSVRRDAPSDPGAWIETWQGRLSPLAIETATHIVDRFGLADLYGDNPMPLCSPDLVLLGTSTAP
jgi:hypothetical protein